MVALEKVPYIAEMIASGTLSLRSENSGAERNDLSATVARSGSNAASVRSVRLRMSRMVPITSYSVPWRFAGSAAAAVETAKAGYEYRKQVDGGWVVTRKRRVPVLRAGNIDDDDPDWKIFCGAFRLDPSFRSFELTTDTLDPFLADGKGDGLRILDMETRSLIQVLFFLSQGVEVPPEDTASGVAPKTTTSEGMDFDWQQVLGGLFKVRCARGKKPPPGAHVAVQHKGRWFYIEDSDADSKSTFHLVMELSRLEVGVKTGQGAPILTLPLNGH